MNNNRLKEIGVITKPHSYRGAVVIRLNTGLPEDFENIKSLFLQIEGRAVPFMVESAATYRNDSLITTFIGYETTDRVAEFIGCIVLAEDDGENRIRVSYQNLLTGFSLFDNSDRYVGKIVAVSESKFQWLATIETEAGKRFLLPVHDDLIISVDEDAKKVVMLIPDGIENLEI